MRTQLIKPNNDLVSAETYDQLFTLHGITMIFFFIIPMTTGAFGNYLIPLMIGARDMAFPRLNALSYWIFLASAIFLYTSLALGMAPDAGWFDYVPLANKQFSPGHNIDFYALAIIFNVDRLDADGGPVHRHDLQVTRARDVVQPAAALLLRVPRRVVRPAVRAALPERRQHLPLPRPQRRHALLRPGARRRGAALAAPLLDLRPPRGLHPDRAGLRDRDLDHPRLHAAPASSRSRWSRSPSCSSSSSASASGRTTCSRPGMSTVSLIFFAGATRGGGDPEHDPGVRVVHVVRARPGAVQDAAALHRRLHLHVRHRRPDRDHVHRDPVRPAGDGHVLRDRPFPLHHLRGGRLPDLRRAVLLVPEGHRPDVLRAGWARSASG